MQKQNKKLTETFSIEDLSLADYTLLSCAVQYNIFELIKNRTNQEFSLRKTVPQKILRPLLNALVSFGYIKNIRGSFYALTWISRRFLIESSAKNIVPLMKNSEWYWLLVTAPKKRSDIKLKAETLKAIIEISFKISDKAFREIKKDFPRLFTQESKVLDIGCGKMGILTKIAQQNKKLQVTGIEKNPYALAYLRRTVQKSLGSRLGIVEADAENLGNLNEKFDFIFLSHIIHWVEKTNVEKLINFCKKHLTRDGILIIYEDYLSNNGLFPKESARKNLILSFLGYQIFTRGEIEKLLKKVRFKQISSKVIDKRRILFYACS